MLDFGGGHLTVIIVIEVAVNALFVAAVGEIELYAEGNAQPQRPVAHFLHQRAHLCGCSCTGELLAIGSSEIRRMPSDLRSSCTLKGTPSRSARSLISCISALIFAVAPVQASYSRSVPLRSAGCHPI